MSTFFPTTTLELQAPTTGEDEFGDDLDSYTVESPSVPATIAERRRRVWDPTESRAATITFHEALIPGRFPVESGYLVKEKPTGRTFFVTHVHFPQNVAFPLAVKRLELEDQNPPRGG